MATQPKTTQRSAKRPSINRVSSIKLEVLWRPPKSLLMVAAATFIFSAAGYTALQASDAATPIPPSSAHQASSPAVTVDKSKVLKILPLGDSVTAGSAAQPHAYRLDLRQKLVDREGWKVDYVGSQTAGSDDLQDKEHEGHAGWRTDQLNAKVAAWVTTADPDYILLQTGANDLLQGATPVEAVSRLTTLLASIYRAKPDVTVLVASLTPIRNQNAWNDQAWKDYNAAMPQIVTTYLVQGYSAGFVDVANSARLNAGEPDMTDESYPTALGYEKVADIWYKALLAKRIE